MLFRSKSFFSSPSTIYFVPFSRQGRLESCGNCKLFLRKRFAVYIPAPVWYLLIGKLRREGAAAVKDAETCKLYYIQMEETTLWKNLFWSFWLPAWAADTAA